jgi:lipopolysaccharide transport system ATP-binding protein
MSIAIKAEHLSKKYIIGHARQEHYSTLRETIMNGVKNFRSKLQTNLTKNSETQTHLTEEFWALNDVSFEIKYGERVGIIGRNGAGKSTLLKVLSRITEPSKGRIAINGRVASLLEVGTGFHPELTGRENIFLNGAILGMSRADILRKFDEIVDFSEVEKFLDTPVKRYSSGMYVRLAFAVAAHLEPEVLVVDEVLAVGDAQFQKKCLGKMEGVAREGRTVLFVSHNMPAIKSLCQRAILLKQGQVDADGDAPSITDRYLSLNKVNQSFLRWERPPEVKMLYDDFIDIKEYSITDADGNVVAGDLYRTSNYFVNIKVSIKKFNPRLVLFTSYYTVDESLLFVSDIFDDPSNDIDLKPGDKTILNRIPGEILNSCSYKIELSCVIDCLGWPLIGGQGQMMEFKFHNNIDNNKMQYSSRHPFSGSLKPGIISPIIPWQNKYDSSSFKE